MYYTGPERRASYSKPYSGPRRRLADRNNGYETIDSSPTAFDIINMGSAISNLFDSAADSSPSFDSSSAVEAPDFSSSFDGGSFGGAGGGSDF